MLEYKQLFKFLSHPKSCDARLGRWLRSVILKIFASEAASTAFEETDEDIGPVGFVLVLLLGVTQLGHVCTPGGRWAIYIVLLNYLSFLKVNITTHLPNMKYLAN